MFYELSGRTLVGYPGYPRIPQNFRIYSIKFGKNIRKFFFMYCGIPQYQIPNVLPEYDMIVPIHISPLIYAFVNNFGCLYACIQQFLVFKCLNLWSFPVMLSLCSTTYCRIHLPHLRIRKYFMDDSSVNFQEKVFLHFCQNLAKNEN